MIRNFITAFGMLSLVLLALPQPQAKADMLYNFTFDNCTGTCGGGANYTYGTVQLTQLTPMSVRVLMTLGPNSRFARTGAGEALTFSIEGAKAITIDSITPNFAVGPTNVRLGGAIGDFEYSVSCVACKGGQASNPAGPLAFRVASTSGLSLRDFIATSKGFYFASDIVGINGKTGNVAARFSHEYTPTPEPATLCMTGAAAILLAIWRRRTSKANGV